MTRKKKDDIERELYSTRIDKKLAKKIRQIAADDEIYDYQVVEEAIRKYIAQREGRAAVDILSKKAKK